MALNSLFVVGPPGLHLLVANEAQLSNLALRAAIKHPEAAVRTIRGSKSQTVAAFFDEVAAALQFPSYFGENWAAFDECIVDLEWLPAAAYVLLIANAPRLLTSAGDEDLRILLRIFHDANIEWVTPNAHFPRKRAPTPFHVVLQCTAEELPDLERRLSRLRVQCDRVSLEDDS